MAAISIKVVANWYVYSHLQWLPSHTFADQHEGTIFGYSSRVMRGEEFARATTTCRTRVDAFETESDQKSGDYGSSDLPLRGARTSRSKASGTWQRKMAN
mmetsp:Transcript_5313/g.18778  ORF Transcript_5313/g.18778 Transcript_5313/m.18778 type:complete len:100 (-) Transcript_5313:1947-2246(-)